MLCTIYYTLYALYFVLYYTLLYTTLLCTLHYTMGVCTYYVINFCPARDHLSPVYSRSSWIPPPLSPTH